MNNLNKSMNNYIHFPSFQYVYFLFMLRLNAYYSIIHIFSKNLCRKQTTSNKMQAKKKKILKTECHRQYAINDLFRSAILILKIQFILDLN